MIKDIMDDIISERKSKNIEDDYGIQNCWNKMIDILSKDINETVAYLENCSEEDIYFIDDGIGYMQYLSEVELCAGEGRTFRS